MKPVVLKLNQAQITQALGEFVHAHRAAFGVTDLPEDFTMSAAFLSGCNIEAIIIVGPKCAEGYLAELDEAIKAMKA